MKQKWMITGATGGLGSEFAIACARQGFDLLLTDRQPDSGGLKEHLEEKYRVSVDYRPCNLEDPESRRELYKTLHEEGIKFTGLINVAGIDHEGGFLERPSEQLLQIIRLDIESTVDTTHAILNLRDDRLTFRLINVCSLAGFFPMPYKAIYAASKRFLLDLSIALREEIKDFGTVTALCPAGMPTTTETMRSMFAQGYWGLITSMDPERVARNTLKHALHGHALYVPGFINQCLYVLGLVTPPRLAARFTGNRWRDARLKAAGWKQPQKQLALAKPDC